MKKIQSNLSLFLFSFAALPVTMFANASYPIQITQAPRTNAPVTYEQTWKQNLEISGKASFVTASLQEIEQTQQAKSVPSQPIPSPEELEPLFAQYANHYGVEVNMLKQIAKCESGFNPNAINGPYAGLFQFHASTWVANRNAAGENSDKTLRFNAEESIKTAAFKISRDGTSAWPACSRS